mmetsp:Transcript_7215/g.16153  ORF Transcript_7215/g.16153 Transcript_7215/m.16153 type:complete len:822 (-) Transcript_7215:257-2722(-)
MWLQPLLLSQVDDCTVPSTFAQLRSRPWFCRGSDDLAKCLGAGHTLGQTSPGLCRGRWQWYQLNTEQLHQVPGYTIDADGRWVRVTAAQSLRHAVAFELQAEYCAHTSTCGQSEAEPEYYTTVDVLVVDGDPRHAWDSANPLPAGVEAVYAGEVRGEMYRYYKQRASISLTLGFNANLSASCEPRLQPTVNIGVFCSWTPKAAYLGALDNKQCRYSLKASLIPSKMYDGYDTTLPMAPAGALGYDDSVPDYLVDSGYTGQPDPATHSFDVEIGDFDVVNVTFTREGSNLTYMAGSPTTLRTNGHGLLGGVYVGRDVPCPNATLHDVAENFTALTISQRVGFFCTDAQTSGRYRFAVRAAEEFGPFPPASATTSQGKVGPLRTPLAQDDPNADAKEQTGYGSYRVQVVQLGYLEGRVAPGEPRPLCASYGQWRSFYIDTSGASDAVLDVQLSSTSAISNIYVRAGATPVRSTVSTAGTYDALSPVGHALVTASPCDVLGVTRWHFSTWVEGEAIAAARGLTPQPLSLLVQLRDARLALSDQVTPRSSGGRGYACCGGMRLFRLPDVPEAASLQAEVTTARGRAHGVFLKWDSCPSLADLDKESGSCSGFCTLQWLSLRGEYSGTLYNSSSALVRVPYGVAEAPDKRRGGAWYIGVKALPDEAVEFSLRATLFEPPPSATASTACDRFTAICSADSSRSAFHVAQQHQQAPPTVADSTGATANDTNGSAAANASATPPPPVELAPFQPPPSPLPQLSLESARGLLAGALAGRTMLVVGLVALLVLVMVCVRTANRIYRQRVLYSDWWYRFTEETRVGQQLASL